MTDAEALEIADKTDLWILNGADARPMRTLRDAIGLAMASGERSRLYRPGGLGATTIWIEREQIVRLARMFNVGAGETAAA